MDNNEKERKKGKETEIVRFKDRHKLKVHPSQGFFISPISFFPIHPTVGWMFETHAICCITTPFWRFEGMLLAGTGGTCLILQPCVAVRHLDVNIGFSVLL